MAEIIFMDKKRPLSQEAKAAIDRKRKILAVQKLLHCTRCSLKCEKCGTQIDKKVPEEHYAAPLRVPYRFCEGCAEEYVDYIERLKGGGDAGCYWRNEFWLESWRRWIDYKGAVDRFVRSREFERLLRELQDSTP